MALTERNVGHALTMEEKMQSCREDAAFDYIDDNTLHNLLRSLHQAEIDKANKAGRKYSAVGKNDIFASPTPEAAMAEVARYHPIEDWYVVEEIRVASEDE